MVGFPFQVLEYFRYKVPFFSLKFVFPPSSWAEISYFLEPERLFGTGKVRIVYPVTVWVSGVSQTAKTEVLENDSNSARELYEEDNERICAGIVGCYLLCSAAALLGFSSRTQEVYL